jgi:predicted GNAT family N-acyltransferase
MIFQEIVVGSASYQQELRLRDAVLRRPLGRSVTDEDLAAEHRQLHFGLFDGAGEIAACVVAVPLSETSARIRQMAVDPRHQGKGFGRALMLGAEAELWRRGFRHLCLHARTSVVPFYEKLGYRGTGDEFLEVGISHLKMEKARPPKEGVTPRSQP